VTVYREQTFVERCFCESAAVGPCGCCGRARCARHLERGLCNRCTQFVDRELEDTAARRTLVAGGLAVGIVLATLAAHLTFGILIGLPVGLGTLFGTRAWQRRRAILQLGPALSASRGELPPATARAAPPNPRRPGDARGTVTSRIDAVHVEAHEAAAAGLVDHLDHARSRGTTEQGIR